MDFVNHNYMIRTFWWGLLWSVVIGILFVVTLGIGMIILWIPGLALVIWFLHRLVKGWLRLNENREIE